MKKDTDKDLALKLRKWVCLLRVLINFHYLCRIRGHIPILNDKEIGLQAKNLFILASRFGRIINFNNRKKNNY